MSRPISCLLLTGIAVLLALPASAQRGGGGARGGGTRGSGGPSAARTSGSGTGGSVRYAGTGARPTAAPPEAAPRAGSGTASGTPAASGARPTGTGEYAAARDTGTAAAGSVRYGERSGAARAAARRDHVNERVYGSGYGYWDDDDDDDFQPQTVGGPWVNPGTEGAPPAQAPAAPAPPPSEPEPAPAARRPAPQPPRPAWQPPSAGVPGTATPQPASPRDPAAPAPDESLATGRATADPAPARPGGGYMMTADGARVSTAPTSSVGTVLATLPRGATTTTVGGHDYHVCGSTYYAPAKGGFVAVRPPRGALVYAIPRGYSTMVDVRGDTYYVCNDVYYALTGDPRSDEPAYTVVDVPIGGAITELTEDCRVETAAGDAYYRCGDLWFKARYVAGGVQYARIEAPR